MSSQSVATPAPHPRTGTNASALSSACTPRRRHIEYGWRMTNHTIPPADPAALTLIDIGINLGHDSYDVDRDAVIVRAEAVGVTQMMVTGASVEGSRKALQLARARPGRLFA